MLSGLKKQMMELTRSERVWKLYLYVLNESLAMQREPSKVLEELFAIDKELLKDEVQTLEKKKDVKL